PFALAYFLTSNNLRLPCMGGGEGAAADEAGNGFCGFASRPEGRGVPGHARGCVMKTMVSAAGTLLNMPFPSYQFGKAYDEMFTSSGVPRPHYQTLYRTLLDLPAEDLRKSQQAADLSFLHQGITFTVYGNKEGTEKIFPNDLLPRIIPNQEWQKIEQGLKQRILALNLFLKDIYHDGRILADGVVPRELLYGCRHFRREMRGLAVPRDIYVSVCGTDLVRLPNGGFAVLEDNLRVPSGVSYMLANRKVLKRVFPTL